MFRIWNIYSYIYDLSCFQAFQNVAHLLGNFTLCLSCPNFHICNPTTPLLKFSICLFYMWPTQWVLSDCQSQVADFLHFRKGYADVLCLPLNKQMQEMNLGIFERLKSANMYASGWPLREKLCYSDVIQ